MLMRLYLSLSTLFDFCSWLLTVSLGVGGDGVASGIFGVAPDTMDAMDGEATGFSPTIRASVGDLSSTTGRGAATTGSSMTDDAAGGETLTSGDSEIGLFPIALDVTVGQSFSCAGAAASIAACDHFSVWLAVRAMSAYDVRTAVSIGSERIESTSLDSDLSDGGTDDVDLRRLSLVVSEFK